MSKDKRTALVTGASAGLGEEFCRQLAGRCDVIIAVARRRDRLQALAMELEDRVEVHVVEADLTTIEGITRTLESIRQKGPVDYLVNNAGFGTFGDFADADIGRQIDLVSLHVEAPLRLARGALPYMLERGRGWVINVSSLGALTPLPQTAVYAAAKAFMVSFSQSLQQELAGKVEGAAEGEGIKVQCLCPGLVRTEIHHTGEMNNFDIQALPESMWMDAPDVVAASLQALVDGPLVVVPGEQNRDLAEAMLAAHAQMLTD
ncbi:MAG: SDR family oxidoreductase [Pseudomonadota bacterium]